MSQRRQETIQQFYDELEKHEYDLDALCKTHCLHYEHSQQESPMIIITYNVNRHDDVISLPACRGLIVEDKPPYKMISRGFDVFSMIPDVYDISTLKKATVKEDGSLMFMFKNGNNWYTSTLHNFGDDTPYAAAEHNSNITYKELFYQIVGMPLNEFGENLKSQIPNANTFCFEMCSRYNKIIQQYDVPTLFLITAFGDELNVTEINIPDNLKLPKNVKTITNIDFTHPVTRKDMQQKIDEYRATNFSFEGFVLQMKDGTCVKMKNKYYLVQHNLKYHGWIKATPKLIIPLICDSMIDKVLDNLLQPVCPILVQHVDLYKKTIENEYGDVKNVLEEYPLDKYKNGKEYIEKMNDNKIFIRWKSLFMYLFNNQKTSLDNIWLQHIKKK